MTIDFWKYVDRRYKYLNIRLCVPLWACLVARWCGFSEWMWEQGLWYGLSFDMFNNFLNCAILIGLALGVYAMVKVYRWKKRENLAELERIGRSRRERLDRMHEEFEARIREGYR